MYKLEDNLDVWFFEHGRGKQSGKKKLDNQPMFLKHQNGS